MSDEQTKNTFNALTKMGVPLPDAKQILNARYITSSNEWYVQMADGWLWFDERDSQWKRCFNGPP